MGMISETKTLHLGVKKLNYWLEILYTGRRLVAEEHMLRFLENFEKFWILRSIKKTIFWNFSGQKPIKKNEIAIL